MDPTKLETRLFINNEVYYIASITFHVKKHMLTRAKFVPSTGGKTFKIYNPSTGDAICNIHEALAEDVDLAVRAAQQAFPAWSERNAFERATPLAKLAQLVLRDGAELGRLDAVAMGK